MVNVNIIFLFFLLFFNHNINIRILVKCSLTTIYMILWKQKIYCKTKSFIRKMTKKVLCKYSVWGRRCCNTSPIPGYIKTNFPEKVKMRFVTYNNIRLKCYINFLYMAPHEVVGSPILARAIDYFYRVSNRLKKYNGWFYSNFLTITDISPSVISTCQSISSPGFTSSILTISLGKPTRRELVLGFA